MMVAYLIARRYAGPAGRKLAAALSLFAAVNVPLVYKSVDIWRTVHPQTTVVPKLDPRMMPAFWSAFALMTVVWGVLLALRFRLEKARAALATAAARSRRSDGGQSDEEADTESLRARWRSPPFALLLQPGLALAQEFQKVEGAPRQEVPAVPFVGLAYGFIWIALARLRVLRRPRALPGRQGARPSLQRKLGAELAHEAGRDDRDTKSSLTVMLTLAIGIPPSSHFIYIPVMFLLGIVIGFMLGCEGDARRASRSSSEGRRARGAQGGAGGAPGRPRRPVEK